MAPSRSALTRRNAEGDPLLLEGSDEPIRIIAAVGNQVRGIRKTGEQAVCASVIAGVSGCQQQVSRLARIVAHGVELRIQAPFVRPIQRGTAPFDTDLLPFGGSSDGWSRSSDSLSLQRIATTHGSLVQDPCLAPADKPIVARLVWPIGVRSIFPLKTIPDPRDDPADHPLAAHHARPGNGG